MTYTSRIDPLPAIALAILAVSVPASLVGAWVMRASLGNALVFVGSAAFCAGLLVLVAWPVRYVLAERELVIQFGLMKSRIPYADIEAVTPTRSLLAAPALSRDRLLIRHRGGEAMVSPRDKEGFVRDLASRDPSLAADGSRIARR